MLSTITSVISGRTKICDIDMLFIVGTSSLFSNVMQTVHELMTLLPLHWANITLHLDLVYVFILQMVWVLKKGNYWFCNVIYMCMLIDLLSGFRFISLNRRAHFINVWLNFARAYIIVLYSADVGRILDINGYYFIFLAYTNVCSVTELT